MNYVLCSLLGYFIGNINAAYIISKIRGFDIRSKGSGNAGASNAMIVMGKKAGAITMAADIGKAIVACLLAGYLFPDIRSAKILCGVFCILGHMFPVLMNFRGGKGLASLAGMILAYDPLIFAVLLAVEAVIGLAVDYICVVPITGSVIFTVIYAFTKGDPAGTILLSVISLIVLYKHIQNLRRIHNDTEAHISFLWKKDKEIERLRSKQN